MKNRGPVLDGGRAYEAQLAVESEKLKNDYYRPPDFCFTAVESTYEQSRRLCSRSSYTHSDRVTR
eukprot:3466537-Pyramimonas_sp.AAC.1